MVSGIDFQSFTVLYKTRLEKTPEENERLIQAELFIKNLPNTERELVENYIEQFTDWLAEVVPPPSQKLS